MIESHPLPTRKLRSEQYSSPSNRSRKYLLYPLLFLVSIFLDQIPHPTLLPNFIAYTQKRCRCDPLGNLLRLLDFQGTSDTTPALRKNVLGNRTLLNGIKGDSQMGSFSIQNIWEKKYNIHNHNEIIKIRKDWEEFWYASKYTVNCIEGVSVIRSIFEVDYDFELWGCVMRFFCFFIPSPSPCRGVVLSNSSYRILFAFNGYIYFWGRWFGWQYKRIINHVKRRNKIRSVLSLFIVKLLLSLQNGFFWFSINAFPLNVVIDVLVFWLKSLVVGTFSGLRIFGYLM